MTCLSIIEHCPALASLHLYKLTFTDIITHANPVSSLPSTSALSFYFCRLSASIFLSLSTLACSPLLWSSESHHLIASGLRLSAARSSDNISLTYLHSFHQSIHLGSSLANSAFILDDTLKRAKLLKGNELLFAQNNLTLRVYGLSFIYVFIFILFVLESRR